MNKFICFCTNCGRTTSKAFARTHAGLCKSCATGQPVQRSNTGQAAQRNGQLIDSGWQAHAREEGHYDMPDNY